MIQSVQTAIWFVLVGAAVFNPPLGGLGLLLGYALADKSFALVNIGELIHFPLFITEPVLIVLLIRAVIKSFRERRFQDWQIRLRSPWFWFYGVGLLNILTGFLFSGPIFVLRDAVIVFYGVIAQITVVYVRNIRHIKTIFFVVLGGLVLRLILVNFNPVFDQGVTSFGMYSAFMIIGCLCTLPLWGRFKYLAIIVIMLFVGMMAATDIRTVWVGFFIAYLFIIALLFMLRFPLKYPAVGSSAIFLSILFTVCFLKIGDPQRYDVIRKEFFSMFAGENSPNLMTRLVMWEDALEEVMPFAKPLFDIFDRKVVNPHYFGSEKRPDRKQVDEIAKRRVLLYKNPEPSATTIIMKYPNTISGSAPPKRIATLIDGNKIFRTLFGVPFGKRFIPKLVSAWPVEDRYDPHNSLIAVLYRTGVVGFMLFLLITGGTLLKGFRALKKATEPDQKYVLLAVMSCLVYHLGHSLTDVTLENPFRGGPFWLLLGLMMVLIAMINKKESPS